MPWLLGVNGVVLAGRVPGRTPQLWWAETWQPVESRAVHLRHRCAVEAAAQSAFVLSGLLSSTVLFSPSLPVLEIKG